MALASLGSACVQFNDDCEPLVADPNAVVGYLGQTVFVDKPNARNNNNAIAQLAADAYVSAAIKEGAGATIGVINGGNVRADGICVTRDILPAGQITSGVFHQVLPFNDQVYVVTVSGDELLQLMEQGAADLTPDGGAITNPPGNFLHLGGAGSTVELDCSQPPGSRVVQMTVGEAGEVASEASYRLAITDFLILQGAGTSNVLSAKFSDPTTTRLSQVAGGVDSYVAEVYMRDTYDSSDHALVQENRVLFENCEIPPPPTN